MIAAGPRPSGRGRGCGRLQSPLLLPSTLLLRTPFLFRKVVTDDAAGYRAHHRVMPRDVPRNGAYGGTLQATLGLGTVRCAEHEERGHGRRNPLFRQSPGHFRFLVSEY